MLLCLVVATFAGVLAVFALHDQPAFYAQGDKDAYTVHWDADPAHAAAPPIVGASGGNKYWQENNAVHPHHFPSARPPKKPNGTIYSALSENSAFSRLLKVVNISDEIISVLNDSSITLTFFALPNQAIPKPLTHKQPSRKETLDFAGTDVSLTELVTHVESFDTADMDAQSRPQKEVIKKIVTAVLSYHILPDSLDVAALKKNTTYATKLSRVFGALNDGPLRLRVGSALPFVRINSYSDVIVPDIKATNGLIHVVDRPLIIPSSVFQKLFLLQHEFSTLSSAIQRTGLTDVVDYKLIHRSFVELPATVGSPVVTIFAPSNKAFAKLPKKLQLFLFSPFGKRALKKILQYHVVPNVTLHSDWVLNLLSNVVLQTELDTDAFQSDFVKPVGVMECTNNAALHDDADFDASEEHEVVDHGCNLQSVSGRKSNPSATGCFTKQQKNDHFSAPQHHSRADSHCLPLFPFGCCHGRIMSLKHPFDFHRQYASVPPVHDHYCHRERQGDQRPPPSVGHPSCRVCLPPLPLYEQWAEPSPHTADDEDRYTPTSALFSDQGGYIPPSSPPPFKNHFDQSISHFDCCRDWSAPHSPPHRHNHPYPFGDRVPPLPPSSEGDAPISPSILEGYLSFSTSFGHTPPLTLGRQDVRRECHHGMSSQADSDLHEDFVTLEAEEVREVRPDGSEHLPVAPEYPHGQDDLSQFPPTSPRIPKHPFPPHGRARPHLPKRPTHAPHAKPEFIANYTLPTALANHTLNVLVVRLPIRLPFPRHSQRIGHVTRMILNGQPVKLHDGVALNGAIHIIDRLLSPHPLKGRPEHGRPRPPPAQENIFESYDAEHAGENNLDDWEDWELWLPAWAEEN